MRNKLLTCDTCKGPKTAGVCEFCARHKRGYVKRAGSGIIAGPTYRHKLVYDALGKRYDL